MYLLSLKNRAVKSFFLLVIFLFLCVPCFSFEFAGGTGEPNDPYQIATAAQLLQIGSDPNLLNKCYILLNDIDLDPNVTGIPPFRQAPIAPDTKLNISGFQGTFFTGCFDGNDHLIMNLIIDANEKDYIGLFGYSSGGEIKDLNINSSLIKGKNYVGTLCGLSDSKITRCDVNGLVIGNYNVGGIVGESHQPINSCNVDIIVAGEYATGGLAGYNWRNIYDCNVKGLISGEYQVGGIVGMGHGHTKNCIANVIVSGTYDVGGLIGCLDCCLVEDCSSSGSVDGIDIDLYNQSHNVGGLIGEYRSAGVGNAIKNCSSDASVTGSYEVGGLIGHADDLNILFCYFVGNVQGIEDIGGLIGRMEYCQISSSYSQCDVTGECYVGGLVGMEMSSSLISCFSAGTVTGNGYCIGGLAGTTRGVVSNCYSSSIVGGTGEERAGLVGCNDGGLISYCYFAGKVIGAGQSLGALVSLCIYYIDESSVVFASYWDSEKAGVNISSGGKPKTTLQMKSLDTFIGWGKDGCWVIDDGNDYPRLIWENTPGRIIENDPNRYPSGDGSTENPFQINSAQQFSKISYFPEDFNKSFILTADCDLASIEPNILEPIGNKYWPFLGTFDGNNYLISNLIIKKEKSTNVGMFGYLGKEYSGDPNEPNTIIKNVYIDNSEIHGTCNVGILAGFSGEKVDISNCLVSGSVYTDNSYSMYGDNSNIGGLVGFSKTTSIENCSTSVYIETDVSWNIGGLIGVNNRSLIYSCFSEANITSQGYNVGGLVGSNSGQILDCNTLCNLISFESVGGLVGNNGGIIQNSFSCGDIIASGEASGGLIGKNGGFSINDAFISDCYSKCNVNGNHYVGGFVGEAYGIIRNSYSEGNVVGQRYIAGFAGYLDRHAQIQSSYSVSNVNGDSVAGFAGFNSYFSLIENCYFAGTVEGDTTAAGFVYSNDGYITYCYTSGCVSSPNNYGFSCGGEGSCYLCYWNVNNNFTLKDAGGKSRTTEQMKNLQTYKGWGIDGKWKLNDGLDYPHLAWEQTDGQIIVDDPNRYPSGVGDSNDPYQIHNVQQFIEIVYHRDDFDKHFILMNNLDFSDVNQNDIYPLGNPAYPFTGVFDGNYLTIKNLKYISERENYLGLFGYISNPYWPESEANGIVQNLFIENIKISGSEKIGGIASINDFGIIQNCSVSGEVKGNDYSSSSIGGIVGYNLGKVAQCSMSGIVKGYIDVGGISASNSGLIKDSCVFGQIEANSYVGGISGSAGAAPSSFENPTEFFNCYSSASVKSENGGPSAFLGFKYYVDYVYFTNCFWDVNISDTNDGVGNFDPDPYGVFGLTTEQMQTASTFIDSGWDFTNVWAICEGTNYPRLKWQIPQADLLCPDGVDFLDFAFFADYWLNSDCSAVNNCNRVDFDLSGIVDSNDLNIFTYHWLQD